jgi:hypothetical protein
MLYPLPFGEINEIFRFQTTNRACSRNHLNPAPHSPSARVLPIWTRKASRRGRGDVFDQPIGVGRFHALQPTFGGLFSVIPIQ